MNALPGNTHRPRLLAAMAIVLGLSACASHPTQDETQAKVADARATLDRFVRDPGMHRLREHIGQAKAVLISPRLWQAGFILGGSGGSAVALTRNGSNWAGPAFYHIGSGTLGLQAGVQASEVVAVALTQRGVNALLSTTFKFGGDVSVAAGPVGAGMGAPIGADIVYYTRSKGLYGGLNLDGTVISADARSNQTYYGRPVTPADILKNQSVSNPYSQPLIQVLQNAVNGARGASQ